MGSNKSLDKTIASPKSIAQTIFAILEFLENLDFSLWNFIIA